MNSDLIDQNVRLKYMLRRCVDTWPEFDDEDEAVGGADLVEWFAEYRSAVQDLLKDLE